MNSISQAKAALLTVFLCLSALAPAQAVGYAVDGWKLGDSVSDASLQTYSCKPSDEFAQLTSCNRTQTRNRGYNYSSFGTVMHDENGVIVSLKLKVAPVLMTRNDIQKEIVELSGELGGKPQSVDWVDGSPDVPASVIEQWGQIKLERLDFDTSETVRSGHDPRIGILVDSLGDVQRSAKAGSEIYRIAEGPVSSTPQASTRTAMGTDNTSQRTATNSSSGNMRSPCPLCWPRTRAQAPTTFGFGRGLPTSPAD